MQSYDIFLGCQNVAGGWIEGAFPFKDFGFKGLHICKGFKTIFLEIFCIRLPFNVLQVLYFLIPDA
jgi:hypothetical protein